MLFNYLQQAIHKISHFHIEIFHKNIPVTLSIATICIITLFVLFFKKINLTRILGWVIVILLLVIGYQSTDYYLNPSFYEIQQNWHYIAYALFVFVNYRLLQAQQASEVRIIWNSFIKGLSISALDEFLQVFLSRRIFDPCDIAKDLWGVMIGLIILFFIFYNGNITKYGWQFRHKSIKIYFNHPITSLFLAFIFSYIFLIISSVLTESKYLFNLTGILITACTLFFFFWHFSQFKIIGKVILVFFITIFLFFGYRLIKNYSTNITSNSYGLIVYKGIPIPFFDVMIFPGGGFRIVDKKDDFNNVDKKLIFNKDPDILLIGTGKKGKGGQGIGDAKEVQFIFNSELNKAIQVIKLKTPEACKTFNRLKDSGHKVLFIINNS
jgi:VanZ family protein